MENSQHEQLYLALNAFGPLTMENIAVVAEELGENLTDEDVAQMIAAADLNEDGEIDEHEFLRLVLRNGLL